MSGVLALLSFLGLLAACGYLGYLLYRARRHRRRAIQELSPEDKARIEAEEEYFKRRREAEREIATARERHKQAVAQAKKQLEHAQNPGPLLATCKAMRKTIRLYSDRLVTPEGTVVLTPQTRASLDQVGPQMHLSIDTGSWSGVFVCSQPEALAARQLALQIGIAAQNLPATQQQRDARLRDAQEALQAAEANMAPIEAAQSRLDHVKGSAPPSISDPAGKPSTAKPRTRDFLSRPRLISASAAIVLLAVLFVAMAAWNGTELQAAQNKHATATAIVLARARSTSSAIASKTAVVKAAVGKKTSTARAKRRATVQALAQRTKLAAQAAAAPGQTATAVSRSTAGAIAAANSKQATAQAAVLLDISGSSNTTTQKFTTPRNDWDLQWSYDCGSAGENNFIVDVHNSDGSTNYDNQGINDLAVSKSGTSHYHVGGTFYLTVEASCPYKLKAVAR